MKKRFLSPDDVPPPPKDEDRLGINHAELSSRAYNVCKALGIVDVQQIADLGDDLEDAKNCGKETLAEFRAVCEQMMSCGSWHRNLTVEHLDGDRLNNDLKNIKVMKRRLIDRSAE